MKKIITLVLSLTMVLALVACGSETSTTTETSASVSTETTVENNTSTPEGSVEDNNGSNDVNTGDSIGSTVYSLFTAAVDAGKKGEEITVAIAEGFDEVGLMPMPLTEGYIPGFDADVTGFANCYSANPMISTIPFVCYVFELNTTDEAALNTFLEGLKAIANPRWNVCTEAEEVITNVYGGYVFYGMFPGADF